MRTGGAAFFVLQSLLVRSPLKGSRRLRAAPVRAAFAAAVLLCAWYLGAAGEAGDGSLRVELDAPAMVCITSLEDGTWRVPPDGRTVPQGSRVEDFYDPPPWRPGSPGPVRLTKGQPGGQLRSGVYEGLSSIPLWQEPAAYFVPGGFSIRLPAGRWRLAVARGLEYLPHVEQFELAASGSLTRRIALRRWVDMPRRGWYSGDDHVHHPRTRPEDNEFLLTWAMAEDVRVLNILRMGDLRRTYFEQAGYGPESRVERGGYVLVSGQEDPRTDIGGQGHTIALNITAPVRDTSRYRLYDDMFDGVRRQGGLVGYAHKAWAPEWYGRQRPGAPVTWDSSINVPRGKIDFFEILQFRKLGVKDYYDFLNLGFRLTAAAGSDFPWGNTFGEARMYAWTGRGFSVNGWFDAVKRGRTFVTNGPMVELTANGAMPGDEVETAAGGVVRVRARAWAPPEIGAPKLLEVLEHGRAVRTAASDNPARRELAVDVTLRPKSSRWIAVRVTSHNGAYAHTSPVYVRVNGGSFRHEEDLPRLVEERLGVLDYIDRGLQDEKTTRTFSPGEADELRKRVAEARAVYEGMARR